MYFNTGASNLGKHAVVHDGTNFKALAFVDEIATNAEFVELKEKVDLLIGDDVDTDTIIDSWKEVQAFLADIEDTKTLQGMLSSYLPLSGGTISGDIGALHINRSNEVGSFIGYSGTKGTLGYLGFRDVGTPGFFDANWNAYYLLHSGNIGDYNAGSATKLQTARTIWGQSFDGTGNVGDAGKSQWVFLNSGGDGIYIHGSGVSWHDSSNGWIKDCMSFNSSGNVLIGTNTDDYSGAKLQVSGSIGITENYKIGGLDVLRVRTDHLAIGEETAAYSSLPTKIYGEYITLQYSKDKVGGFILNSSGNVTIGDSDLAGTNAKLLVGGNAVIGGAITVDKKDTLLSLYSLTEAGIMLQSDGSGGDVATIYEHKGAGNGLTFAESSRDFIWRTGTDAYKGGGAGTERMRLTNGGNVGIGTTDPKYMLHLYSSSSSMGALFVIEKNGAYDARLELTNTVDKFRLIQQSSGNAYISLNGNHSLVFETSNTARMCITGGGNVGIGTPDPQKKLHVVGDLYVDGNIIATKEVSAGGAGQEGESGDGGAEVISQQLASGQSTYTITNTIKRSDIAVSLYEWNANNGSWDMCLADISVKDATITVTFGSATSVNHKLVAVG
jgi:hypothetical protein